MLSTNTENVQVTTPSSSLLGARFVAQLRRSKKEYFAKLNPKDLKKFWKTVKSLKKTSQSIPTLSHNGACASDDMEKGNMLNSFFSTCFNTSHPPLSDDNQNMFASSDCPVELLCTVDEVEHLLRNLDLTKATGPDGVSATMLKHTATSIAPSVTKLFNLSITLGQVPSEWKDLWWFPSQSQLTDPHPPIIALSPFCQFSA